MLFGRFFMVVAGFSLLALAHAMAAELGAAPVDSAMSWPDASNTGVPSGVRLRHTGSIIVDKPGTVISEVHVQGTVQIKVSDVTLRQCKVSAAAFNVVEIASGVTGVVVEDCEIDGVGTGNDGSNGILGTGTFRRNNISNVENGITLNGDATLIEGNYIHGLRASGAPHYDGIQIDGNVSRVVIRGNTIINDNDGVSAVMIDNYFGPISDITVHRNLLVGGGYTVYSDAQFKGGPISGVSFTENRMGRGGWGFTAFNKNRPIFVGNVYDGAVLARTLKR